VPCGQALPTKGEIQALGLVPSFFYALAHPRRGLEGLGRIKPKAYFNLFEFIYKQPLKVKSPAFLRSRGSEAMKDNRKLLIVKLGRCENVLCD